MPFREAYANIKFNEMCRRSIFFPFDIVRIISFSSLIFSVFSFMLSQTWFTVYRSLLFIIAVCCYAFKETSIQQYIAKKKCHPKMTQTNLFVLPFFHYT